MLSNYYYCCSPSTLTFSRRPSRSSFLRCSIAAATTKTSSPSPSLEPHLMIDYLTTSYGLSLDRATKVSSKYLSHLKSTDRPDSFLGFLRSYGFNDTQIRKIVCSYPQFLCSDAQKTLAPKLKAMQDLGFSDSDIVCLIHSSPHVLNADFHRSVLPRIQFWESLLGSRDHLVNLFKIKHGWFLLFDPEKRAVPNVSLLREYCGISDERISYLLRKYPRLIVQKPEVMSAAIEHLEKNLGIPRQSGMFPYILYSLMSMRKSSFDAKLKLMKSFGWSKSEFVLALCKAPNFVTLSSETLSRKMNFFLKEAGCEPSEVAHCSQLLLCSLHKKLIPRHNVMKFLKSRGLITREYKISYTMIISNKLFMEKYIIPHRGKHPELQEMYMAGCDSGQEPLTLGISD